METLTPTHAEDLARWTASWALSSTDWELGQVALHIYGGPLGEQAPAPDPLDPTADPIAPLPQSVEIRWSRVVGAPDGAPLFLGLARRDELPVQAVSATMRTQLTPGEPAARQLLGLLGEGPALLAGPSGEVDAVVAVVAVPGALAVAVAVLGTDLVLVHSAAGPADPQWAASPLASLAPEELTSSTWAHITRVRPT